QRRKGAKEVKEIYFRVFTSRRCRCRCDSFFSHAASAKTPGMSLKQRRRLAVARRRRKEKTLSSLAPFAPLRESLGQNHGDRPKICPRSQGAYAATLMRRG